MSIKYFSFGLYLLGLLQIWFTNNEVRFAHACCKDFPYRYITSGLAFSPNVSLQNGIPNIDWSALALKQVFTP